MTNIIVEGKNDMEMDREVIVFRTKTTTEGCYDAPQQRSLAFVFEGKKSQFPKEKECYVFSKGKETEFFNQLGTGKLCMVNAEDGCDLIQGFEEHEMDWLDEFQRQLGIEETADFLIECARHNCNLGVSLLLSASRKEMSFIWARSNVFLDVDLARIVFTPENTRDHSALLSDCRSRLPEELLQTVFSCDEGAQDGKEKTGKETEEEAQKCATIEEQAIKRSRYCEEVPSPFSVRMCFNEEEMTPENHLLFEQSTAFHAGNRYGNAANCAAIQNDLKRAVQQWQERADKGSRAAMNNLGVCYASGHGVAANPQKAVQLWQKASEMGDVSGAFNLAMCCFNGIGTDVNKTLAIELLTRAKAMGSKSATIILGMCYEKGDGVHQDFEMAASNYREALESKVSERLLQRLQEKHLI